MIDRSAPPRPSGLYLANIIGQRVATAIVRCIEKAETMTKNEIVAHLAEKAGVTKGKAGDVLGALTDLIHVELRSGREIILPEVGRLHVVKKAARQGKAPADFGGKAWSSPEGKAVKLKVAKVLADAVA